MFSRTTDWKFQGEEIVSKEKIYKGNHEPKLIDVIFQREGWKGKETSSARDLP